jgi:hypothetical protein
MRKGFSLWIRALGRLVDERNRGSKISWHCPWKRCQGARIFRALSMRRSKIVFLVRCQWHRMHLKKYKLLCEFAFIFEKAEAFNQGPRTNVLINKKDGRKWRNTIPLRQIKLFTERCALNLLWRHTGTVTIHGSRCPYNSLHNNSLQHNSLHHYSLHNNLLLQHFATD